MNLDELDGVVGGVNVVVNNSNAERTNVRATPGLDGEIIASVQNGTQLFTLGKKIEKDGYTWHEVCFMGGCDTGWIVGSFIGH